MKDAGTVGRGVPRHLVAGGAWPQKDLLEPPDRQDGVSFPDMRGSASPAGDTLVGGKASFFSYPFLPS